MKDHKIGIKFSVIGIVLISCLISLIPFINIFFPKGYIKDIFGFSDLGSFLYAIGQPLSLFLFSVGILYFSMFTNKKERRVLQLFCLPFIATSVFNIIWVFYYESDLPKWAYYTIMVIASVALTFSVWSFFKYKESITSKFVKTINYILYNRAETIFPLVKEEDQAKRAEIALENEDKLKETLNEVF